MISKEEILEKYGAEIAELTEKVFNVWSRAVIPLALKIVENEGLSYLEAKMLLDTLMVETIRDLVNQHRYCEKKAEEMSMGGDE